MTPPVKNFSRTSEAPKEGMPDAISSALGVRSTVDPQPEPIVKLGLVLLPGPGLCPAQAVRLARAAVTISSLANRLMGDS